MGTSITQYTGGYHTWVPSRQQRTLLEAVLTDLGELRTELTALRADYTAGRTQIVNVLADLTAVRTQTINILADLTAARTALVNARVALTNMSLADGGIAIGTTTTKIKTAATVNYLIAGVFYAKAATDDFWTLTGFNCTNGNFNKCLLCIDSAGAMQIAVGTEGASAGAVVLPAIPASYAVVGMVQVNPTGTGDFTGGTTDLDDGTVVPNATYTDLAFHPDTFAAPAALTASNPAALTAANPAALTSNDPAALELTA